MDWITNKPIAHRGLHRGTEVPENSMRAFELAIQQGYPIELDVHLLTDGHLAVFHDDTLERMTTSSDLIWNKSSTEISSLRLYETDSHIPLFDEVLSLVNSQVPILIEIKNTLTVGNLEQELFGLLSGYNGEYAIQSFNPYSVGWFKTNAPSIIRGQLASNFKDTDLEFYKKFLLRHLFLTGISSPHFVAYDIDSLPSFATWLWRRRKNPLLAWTIRTEDEMQKAQKFCDNIIFEDISP